MNNIYIYRKIAINLSSGKGSSFIKRKDKTDLLITTLRYQKVIRLPPLCSELGLTVSTNETS